MSATQPIHEPQFESGASADHSNLCMKRPTLDNLPAIPSDLLQSSGHKGYYVRKIADSAAEREQVSAVFDAAFGTAHGQWTAERVIKDLTGEASVKNVFVAVEVATGKVVASASSRLLPVRFPDHGYLHWVAVHPAHQSAGLGYLISLVVLHDFVALGQKAAVLETQDERLAAISCYEKLGFSAVMVDDGQPARWKAINEQRDAYRKSKQ